MAFNLQKYLFFKSKTLFKSHKDFDIYGNWTDSEIKTLLYREAMLYNLPDWVFDLINESVKSEFRKLKGYDGASVIEDKRHPCIAYWLHDYFWRMQMGGYFSNVLMLYIDVNTSWSMAQKDKALEAFYGVQSVWNLKYKWLKRNRKDNLKVHPREVEILGYIKADKRFIDLIGFNV